MAVRPRSVMQKLLSTGQGEAIVEDGFDQVGGVVVHAGDVAALRTPEAVLRAYGVGGAPEFVDVVRFEQPWLSRLTRPSVEAYPTGFLRGDGVVPVWELSPTRYSHGAEYWRIRADGEQKVLSAYAGAAQGWRGAQGWRPPSPLVGTRARWRGREFPADVVGEGVLLTALTAPGDPAPEGWKAVRQGAYAAAVPLGECELFEVVMTGRVNGVAVRMLAVAGEWARVQLSEPDAAAAARIGAEPTEPGVFQARVRVADVADRQGVTNELAPS